VASTTEPLMDFFVGQDRFRSTFKERKALERGTAHPDPPSLLPSAQMAPVRQKKSASPIDDLSRPDQNSEANKLKRKLVLVFYPSFPRSPHSLRPCRPWLHARLTGIRSFRLASKNVLLTTRLFTHRRQSQSMFYTNCVRRSQCGD
jgi:hypothetical protein